MKELIKIEKFLKVYENTWAVNEYTYFFYAFSLPTKYTLHVDNDFGNYPNLIGFEAELLMVNKSLINEKIKSINSICDKMISDYDNHRSKRKFQETKIRTSECYLTPFDNNENTKVLKFDDIDLINTICEIKSIIESMPADQKGLTTDASIVRLTKIWQLLKKENHIDNNTIIDNWLYWFGKKTAEKPKKIKWIGADSTLSNVIYQICGTSSKIAISTAFEFNGKYQKPTKTVYKTTLLWNEINKCLNYAENKLD